MVSAGRRVGQFFIGDMGQLYHPPQIADYKGC